MGRLRANVGVHMTDHPITTLHLHNRTQALVYLRHTLYVKFLLTHRQSWEKKMRDPSIF